MAETPVTQVVHYRVVSMAEDGSLLLRQVDETPNEKPREVTLPGMHFLIEFDDAGRPHPFACRRG